MISRDDSPAFESVRAAYMAAFSFLWCRPWPMAKRSIVYVPSRSAIRGAAVELRAAADKDRTLPLALLRHCQFPASVADGAGGTVMKPPSW
jgi:hypothetical protein